MQLTQIILLGLSLTTMACAATTSAGQPKAPVRGGVLEIRVDSYEGETVEGRILLGATVDPLVIDSRIWWGLNYNTLHACGTTEPLFYIPFSFIIHPARPEDIITLKPGTWYGERMRFPISMQWKDKIGPDCLEVTLRALDNDERIIAELPIRVERTDKKPAPNEPLAK